MLLCIIRFFSHEKGNKTPIDFFVYDILNVSDFLKIFIFLFHSKYLKKEIIAFLEVIPACQNLIKTIIKMG